MSSEILNFNSSPRGTDFEVLALKVLQAEFGWQLQADIALPIGVGGGPKKHHRFDLVSQDNSIVGEAKNFTWTSSGNMPSAKMAAMNQAVFYLHLLPDNTQMRFIAMPHSVRPGKTETLAEYYLRTYEHLLGKIRVFEIDQALAKLKLLKG